MKQTFSASSFIGRQLTERNANAYLKHVNIMNRRQTKEKLLIFRSGKTQIWLFLLLSLQS